MTNMATPSALTTSYGSITIPSKKQRTRDVGPQSRISHRLDSIQIFVALLYVLSQYYADSAHETWDRLATILGQSQVTSIHVLSGFLVSVYASRVSNPHDPKFRNWRTWTLDAVARIYPMYLLMILTNVIQLYLQGKHPFQDSAKLTWTDILVSIFMLQTWVLTSHSDAINPAAKYVGALLFNVVVVFPVYKELVRSIAGKKASMRWLLGVLWVYTFYYLNDLHATRDLDAYVNYIPLHAHTSCFLFGVTLGMLFEQRDMSRDVIIRRSRYLVVISIPLLILALSLLATWFNLVLDTKNTKSLLSYMAVRLYLNMENIQRWLIHGGLVPLYGLALWTLAIPNDEYSILSSRPFTYLGQLGYSIFLSHSLVWNISFHVSCRMQSRDALLNKVCWVTTAGQLVSPIAYFSLLLVFAIVLHSLVERPLYGAESMVEVVNKASHPSSDVMDAEELEVPTKRPGMDQAIWVVVYYIYAIVFFAVVFAVCLPDSVTSKSFSANTWWSSDAILTVFGLAVIHKVKFICLLGLIPLSINIIGHLRYPPVARKRPADDEVAIPQGRMFFRIVTRGNNPHLVMANASEAFRTLQFHFSSEDRFVVEVVTDKRLDLPSQVGFHFVEMVVPDSYQTSTGAKYKARALQFAIETSAATNKDWIIHLDEETRFSSETVRAICQFVIEQESKPEEMPGIGQGVVLYGDGDICNIVTTLADSYRVADDYGKFRIQYAFGECIVGMHGSFVVCRHDVERLVTFDHGLAGSITEDTYFAFLARTYGIKFHWIHGIMYEQSPFTLVDFAKQRARWIGGLIRVCLETKIPFRYRYLLWIFTAIWLTLPLSLMIYFLMGILSPTEPKWFNLCLVVIRVFACWNYVLGFLMTFDLRKLGAARYLVFLFLQLFLMPYLGILESCAVLYAVWNVRAVLSGFHIVEKERFNRGKGNVEDKDDESPTVI